MKLFFTTEDAAFYLGISKDDVINLVLDEKLEAFKNAAGTLLIYKAELIMYSYNVARISYESKDLIEQLEKMQKQGVSKVWYKLEYEESCPIVTHIYKSEDETTKLVEEIDADLLMKHLIYQNALFDNDKKHGK